MKERKKSKKMRRCKDGWRRLLDEKKKEEENEGKEREEKESKEVKEIDKENVGVETERKTKIGTRSFRATGHSNHAVTRLRLGIVASLLSISIGSQPKNIYL